MDCSYPTVGCYLEPVQTYLDDVVKAFDYLKNDELHLDAAGLLLKEADEYKVLAQNWESLGAIPPALKNYSEFVKRLLFIRDKSDLSYSGINTIQEFIDTYVDYSIDLYLKSTQ